MAQLVLYILFKIHATYKFPGHGEERKMTEIIVAFIASFFEQEISWVTGMLCQLQRTIWFTWGLTLFPFIMIHADNQDNKDEEDLYAITFTYDELWQQRFQRYLESEAGKEITEKNQR